MKKFFILALIVILLPPVKAQSDKIGLTRNLQIDSKLLFSENLNMEQLPVFSVNQFQSESDDNGKKSPFLSGLFSLVLPGSGEFYSESYLKAGIFLAIEAAVVTTAIIYNKKGNNKTNEFQNYADDPVNGWSVVRYAKWIVKNKDLLGLTDYTEEKMNNDIFKSNAQSLPIWEQVNFYWLNYYESQVTVTYFTHQLYPHGEQQYYELIGKYHQFSPGWAEFNPDDANTNDIPPQMNYYSGLRGKANDLYNIAETAVVGIYINHFLSALDGVWSAVRFNKDIAFNARVNTINFADRALLVPTFNIKYNF